MLSKINKIYLLIISCIIVFIFTNLSNKTINNTDNLLYNLFFHNEGSVCPFGVLCENYLFQLHFY